MKMISVRCHPKYHGKINAWYDWGFVRFEEEHGQMHNCPRQILSCIQRNIGGNVTKFDLVFQSCGQPTGRESILFTQWSFNRDLNFVPATALATLCFVLVSNPADRSVLVVKYRSLWASNFYDAAQTIYAYDEVEEYDSNCQQ